jgi:hypothetical protein
MCVYYYYYPHHRPWPLSQFLNPMYSSQEFFTRNQAVTKPLLTHTGQHKHRKTFRDIQASRGIRIHNPKGAKAVEGSLMVWRGRSDRQNIYIHTHTHTHTNIYIYIYIYIYILMMPEMHCACVKKSTRCYYNTTVGTA